MKENIRNTCQELLRVCEKNGLSISDMFEVWKVSNTRINFSVITRFSGNPRPFTELKWN